MAEAIGTVIGVVGFLGQLFDGCVKAYRYFSAASNLDSDSQRLLCKVRIEEMRLVVWGREWGVAEGKLEKHLESEEARNPQLRHLATQILQELHGTVTDFQRLRERYGLVDEDGRGNGAGGKGNGEKMNAKGGKGGGNGQSKHRPPCPELAAVTPGGGGGRKETETSSGASLEKGVINWRKEITRRTRWVIADKDKFTNLLKDLKDFNDGLERLFPPSHLPSFQRAWTHQLLESAQRDLNQLSLLKNASSGVYPQLNTTATLKSLRINLDAKPQSAFKPTFALKVPRQALTIQSDNPLRCQAHHETVGDVVVEWVDYDREAIEERVAHVRRLDDLARMMHSASSSHPDLHSIDCVGYVDDASRCRYGLVYQAPESSFSTLHALMSSTDLKTPDLSDRVLLARTLAVALWSLHSLDWLHKSLCGSNILFFPSEFSTSARSPTAAAALVPSIANPYLSGFDASRPDLDTALSVAPKNPSIGDLHRHPASLRGATPYLKAFDIYSLGLVLLEIGLWKVLQTYHKPHYSAQRWRDKVVMAVLVPGLGSKTGTRYREVVEMCLGAGAELSSEAAGQLMGEVVAKLESIRV